MSKAVARVQSAPHELEGNLIYTDHGVAPYWGFRKFVNELNGGGQFDIEIEGEPWTVSVSYQQSGLAPRPDDTVDRLYEYRVNAHGPGEAKATYLIQPRWPELKTRDGKPVNVPKELDKAVNVRIAGSNLEPERYPALLPNVLHVVAQQANTFLDFEYFTGELHEFSNIYTYERYARVLRNPAQKSIDRDGIFMRIWNLLADVRGSKAKFTLDNTEIVGYNFQLALNRKAASELFPGGRRGFRLKHYHPKHVRGESKGEDPLFHPKIGVSFQKRLNSSSVPWSAHRELTLELEENLINVLEWADIPSEPGPSFVPDDHFQNVASPRQVALYSDPTPEIEIEQQHLLVKEFAVMTDTDIRLLEQLVADGGRAHYEQLANDSGCSVSTVYRTLKRLDDLLAHPDGNVRFVSEYLYQEVKDICQSVQYEVNTKANAIAHMLNIDPRHLEDKGKAWSKWLTKYAVKPVSEGESLTLKIKTTMDRLKSTDRPTLEAVLKAGRKAWRDSGRDPRQFEEAVVTYPDALTGKITVKPRVVLRK